MFRNRANQKPNDELLASFKASFPHVAATTRPSQQQPASQNNTTSALDLALHHVGDSEDFKDQDPTPRGPVDQWRFTPSLMDPNSFAFASFANQPPGYYTPTPGGTNTLYHSQAGDLHTPGFSMGLGTPLSMPTSEGAIQAGQTSGTVSNFQPHAIAPALQFQNPAPFGLPPQISQAPSLAPHHFTHQQTHFEPMPQAHNDQVLDGMADGIESMPVDIEIHERSPTLNFNQAFAEQLRQQPPQQSLENFRWHVTLNAPTAMIKHADEVPVTYLNKGQAYSVSIVDTAPVQPVAGGIAKYRTYVRISFEDEQQRQRPAACWQLWKEGRGTNEAHQRGGRLQAVEFVDPTQVGGGDGATRPRIELESASFDGFAVTWTQAANGAAECAIAVRFNFLSTDFSHSKGVKGIPVRLCAKTEQVDVQAAGLPDPPKPEICYCKVKLFRDHGAERKLSNDVTHVKKTIDKLKQQIAQVESGMKDFGKRKRSSAGAKSGSAGIERPGKVPKHKRTWSMSSASSTGARPPAEEDLHLKLATLQDMFTSTRPASVLYLRGEELDDPDVHPVHLSGDAPGGELTRVNTGDSTMWDRQSAHNSSVVSPTPSSHSVNSGDRRGSTFHSFPPPSRMGSNDWCNMPQTATGDLNSFSGHTSNLPTKVQRKTGDKALNDWIDAVGVDYSYQPPPERLVKPVACFYIQPRAFGKPAEDSCYRAVYLMQRNLRELVNAIANKCQLEPTRVIRAVRILETKPFPVLLDDQTVLEIPEGQDMVAEFQEIHAEVPMKREWDSGSSDIPVDGDVGAIESSTTSGYELRLYY